MWYPFLAITWFYNDDCISIIQISLNSIGVVFRKIWRALFSWNTCFEIRPFDLLPTNDGIISTLQINQTLTLPPRAFQKVVLK